MNTANSPKNGLPEELNNIPLGQVCVLINPYLGITPGDILTMQFIFSMARQYGQYHVVNTIPVEYSGLWNCCICKVQTMQGVQLLVADNDSLVEMLCEFWGLDYDTVRRDIKLPTRYKVIGINGEKGPRRFNLADSDYQESGITAKTIKPIESSRGWEEEGSTTIQLLQTHSRENTLGDIRSTFKDNFNYGLGISLDDIIALYKEEEQNRKSYKFDIKVKWKEERIYKHPKWITIRKMTRCDISLVDNLGNIYPIKLEAQCKAIYLTYFFFKEGIEYSQITYSDEFYDIFTQIYEQMPRAWGNPSRFNLEDKAQLDTFTNYTSKIRKAIKRVTNDTYAQERFAVEGLRKDAYGVASATDEDRAKIRKEFNIK